MLESLLDEIPQLGESRRKALLERFGSVSAIRKAAPDELAATPGIGSIIAAIIFEYLQNLSESSHEASNTASDAPLNMKVDMATGEILDT